MSRWKAFKKYIMADLSSDKNAFSIGGWGDKPDAQANDDAPEIVTPQDAVNAEPGYLSSHLQTNLVWFKQRFSYPQSKGLVVRRFKLGRSSFQAAVIYIDGQVDWEHLNATVLVPLITLDIMDDVISFDATSLIEEIVTEGQVTASNTCINIENFILMGFAAIFVDGLDTAVIAEIKGWEKKSIDKPITETVVRGSLEGFTDDIQTNLSMIRRRLRTSDLMVEWQQVGTLSQTEVAIVYLKSIANADVVAETRKRITGIQYDYISDSGTIEQFIEDRPNSLFPTVMSTERPDRAAAQIAEGYVSIIVDNSPFALIVPANLPLFLQTAEDANLRWTHGSFIRIIRMIGYFLSLYLPAIYVGIANYHQEMIPTPLITAIAGTRETVPIPVAAEAFMLESMFELIREAGVRIPSVIGPTIGIVGALILGQAAVQANIVSPIVVIITATTALASYTIPNYNLQFASRILRFIYLLSASVLGLVGVVLVSILFLSYRATIHSFGVPLLSPITPHRQSDDTLIRGAITKQKFRPFSIRPKILRKTPDSPTESPSASIKREEEQT